MRVYGAVLGAMGEELESGVSIEAHLREKVTPTLELPEDEYLFHAILGSMMLPAVGELGGIDLKEFNATEEFEGGDWRFVNGYDSIVYGLARGLSIRTGVHVDRIVTSSTGAEVHAGNESWAADYAVVTLPLSVLQSGAVTFEPTLPESIGESIRRLRMGRAEKIALRFPEAFWPAETTLVVRATDELSEFPIFFNNHLPFTGDPILTTWVVGDRLSAFNQLSDGDSAAQVMDALRKTFGSSIPDATGVLRSRWCDDPLSLGVYSTFELGVPSRELRRRFESSVQKRLHFAGEHTHPDRCSTVHGAYLSGQRAAEQIAAHAA
jgi:monoamine oxidase